MATVDLSRVLTPCIKAMKLEHKRLSARAAEHYEAAVEATRELHQPADCLMTAWLKGRHAGVILDHSKLEYVKPEDRTALQRKAPANLDEVMTVLRSRLTAGVLCVEGRSVTEAAFARDVSKCYCKLWGGEERAHATYLFYDSHQDVANYAMVTCGMLLLHDHDPALPGHDAALALRQLKARYDFAGSALDLISQPSLAQYALFVAEELLVENVLFIEKTVAETGGDSSMTQLFSGLLAAWRRFQQSSTLRSRGTGAQIRYDKAFLADQESARSAAEAGRDLRRCALAACAAHEVRVSQFKACGACMQVAYCCKEHQVADWPAHKAACKAARKAAAQAAPSGA